MIEAMKHDLRERFHDAEGGKSMHLEMAYTYNLDAAEAFRQEIENIPDWRFIRIRCH